MNKTVMADINNGTSGSAAKRVKNQRRGRPKKSVSKKSVSNDCESQVTCLKCEEVFNDEDDKMLECWFCVKCLGTSEVEYEIIGRRQDFHWFCSDCEKHAITAVKSDREIEEKCAAYMESMSGKIEKIEQKLNNKAEKSDVVDLAARVRGLESKGPGAQSSEINNKNIHSDTVRDTIEEQTEREFRKRNIIIQNLVESKKNDSINRREEDIESVKSILSIIGINEPDTIQKCIRIGKRASNKTRTTKITVKSVEIRRAILKGSRILKDNQAYQKVFIGPDFTKMQREQDYKLRKELRDYRRDNGETDIFISRGRILQGMQRALNFKGGASGSAGAE